MLTTTAISYTNGKPHIGHLYELILADFIARRDGSPLLTGTDEHGKKIEQVAISSELSPFDLCTRNSNLFRKLADDSQVSYARFIRTTDEDHKELVKRCILDSYRKDDIYSSIFNGWYSIREESYITETDARLTDFKDPVSGIKYEKVCEPAYFFRLSKYREEIKNALKRIDIQPQYALSSIYERLDNLKDLCISRSKVSGGGTSWGIPFPLDDSHVVYVWFDALLNYITGARSIHSDSHREISHIIGKDIVWFHTAIYLGILMSCNLFDEFCPRRIIVHGFIVDENGRKMSKSIGNAIDVDTLQAKFPVEAIRFYFLYTTIMGADCKFSESDLIEVYNNILVKQFGNLFQRLYTLLKPVQGEVNEYLNDLSFSSRREESLSDYFSYIQKLIADANAHLQFHKPWEKSGDEKISILVFSVKILIELLQLLLPVIPHKCNELMRYLGLENTEGGYKISLIEGKIKAFQLLAR